MGTCSLSVNTILGGKTRNAVPDQCVCGVDIRIIPGVDIQDIINDFNDIMKKIKFEHPEFEADISLNRHCNPLETDRNNDFVKELCSCLGIEKTVPVGFTTDGPKFVDLAAPILIFGPGKPEMCHKPDEFIEIVDLEKAVEDYKKIITHFLT